MMDILLIKERQKLAYFALTWLIFADLVTYVLYIQATHTFLQYYSTIQLLTYILQDTVLLCNECNILLLCDVIECDENNVHDNKCLKYQVIAYLYFVTSSVYSTNSNYISNMVKQYCKLNSNNYVLTHTHAHIHTHARTHTHTHGCTRTHIHGCTRTHMDAHAHTCTHTHAHTQTHYTDRQTDRQTHTHRQQYIAYYTTYVYWG